MSHHVPRNEPRPVITPFTSIYPNYLHHDGPSNIPYSNPQPSFNFKKIRYQSVNSGTAKTVKGKKKAKPMSAPSYPIRINPYILALASNAMVIRDPFMSPYSEVQEEFNPFGLEMKSFLSPYPLNLKTVPSSFYDKTHSNHLQNV